MSEKMSKQQFMFDRGVLFGGLIKTDRELEGMEQSSVIGRSEREIIIGARAHLGEAIKDFAGFTKAILKDRFPNR